MADYKQNLNDEDSLEEELLEGDKKRSRGAGGTSGGIVEFLLGLVMIIIGAYMLSNNVVVHSGFLGWKMMLGGMRITAFGVTLIPLSFGIFWLFFDGKSWIGWALTLTSIICIIVGIMMTLDVHFKTVSIYVLVIMMTLLLGGLGIIARSLKEH